MKNRYLKPVPQNIAQNFTELFAARSLTVPVQELKRLRAPVQPLLLRRR